jgi:hypothetical protein
MPSRAISTRYPDGRAGGGAAVPATLTPAGCAVGSGAVVAAGSGVCGRGELVGAIATAVLGAGVLGASEIDASGAEPEQPAMRLALNRRQLNDNQRPARP